MISRIIILFLALATLGHAASPVRSPEKLRSLAMLPPMTASLLIGSDELRHPELSLRTNELPQMIRVLQQQMQKAPIDAERYVLLGTYLKALERKPEAKVAFSNAVSWFRLRAEGRPQDGPLQARFAEALNEIGAGDEAERVLRATIRVVPEDWSCWAGLGQMLAGKATSILFGGTNNLTADTPLKIFSEIDRRGRNPPTRSEIEEADAYLAEADKCFDRAVSLGPKESQAHLARALHRSWNGAGRQILAQFRGLQKIGPKEMLEVIASTEACADWANAARFASSNYMVVANWGWMEALPAVVTRENTSPINAMPEGRRRNVLEAMRWLEDFSENHEPRAAAGALEALGILRYMVSAEEARAKSDFRRSVTLDPLRPQAWDGLLCTALGDNDRQELVSVCEERLKHLDTVPNRVTAAKACDRAKLDDQALSHARAAVKLDSNSPLARLCLGALLLRRAEDQQARAAAAEHFTRVVELVKLSDHDNRDELAIVAGLNMAIIGALDGEVERARQFLQALARQEAAKDQIKERIEEIQSVLGR